MPNCEVAIIGAGPYGLSIAAHLGAAGVDYRIFGVPMQNWRIAMPRGMFLKSDGAGTNLADPAHGMTLAEYCSSAGALYSDHGTPISIETFVSYALSFQRQLVPHVEQCEVRALAAKPGLFEMQLETGERVTARKVVVAVGTTHFGYIPPQLSKLPPELVTHSRDHADLAKFAGREVIVVGGGQSAIETAALLHELGASVRLLMRKPVLKWNPAPDLPMRHRRLAPPHSALGQDWRAWFYCVYPGLFYYFPQKFRSAVVRRALGPAGAWWLRRRVLGRFPALVGHEIRKACEAGGKIQLTIASADGGRSVLFADHAIAATGFKVDIDLLQFLDSSLLAELRREDGAPALSPDFEASIPGLYFAGLASATQFGPAMRFVAGAEYTALKITQSISPESRDLRKSVTVERPVRPAAAGSWRRTEDTVPEFDRSVAALVLNFGKHPFHQGSLGAIRSLGGAGVPVFANLPNRFIPSGSSRYLSGKLYGKGEEMDAGQFLGFMSTLAGKLDGPTVLVPADDFSAILIAENAEALPSIFRFARPPTTLPRTLANKRKLYELCVERGIACPATLFPGSRKEFLDLAQRVQLPVIVKTIEPWLAPRTVRSTVIVSDRSELIRYCDARQVSPTSLMIQEVIPHSDSADWFVHGYCDNRSSPLVMFTGVKLRSYPPLAGPTTLGRSVRNDLLREQAAELVRAIGYWGIMDLDYKFDPRNGKYHLLDFNPRLGAQFRLFQTANGTDVVRAMHLDLTGRAVEAAPQVEGRAFLSEVHDLLAGWVYCRRGNLTLREWFRSLRKIDEVAWFSLDDPWPFLLLCLHMPVRAVRRALHVGT